MAKWADEKTEPTDKLTLHSGSIASEESRTCLGRLPSALQHSILLILKSHPPPPQTAQNSLGQPPEASKRRSGRGWRQLTLSRRPRRRFLYSSTTSRPRRRRCPRSRGRRLGAKSRKIGNLSRASRPHPPAGPCAAQPLVPSAQRSQAPGKLGPGGRGSELRHYEDGHFEHAAGAVPAAGDVVEVEPPRALAVGLAPPAFQELLTLSVSTSGGSTRSSASHRTSTACVLV